MSAILIPIPSRDFDPTEAAVSWRVLTHRGHRVVFATPDGRAGQADDIMLSGKGLDPWGFIPVLDGLRVLGLALRANSDARRAYREMEQDAAFRSPLGWDDLRAADFDALVLPGGHRARGMRQYLESAVLQRVVADFFAAGKCVGAVCHGVLLAARSVDANTGRSVLYGRKTTALTWQLENKAAALARVGRFWDPQYYRTYTEKPSQPSGYMSVEQEVTRALASPEDFLDVPRSAADYRKKTSGTARDSMDDSRPAWVVRDGRYVSARWPGDIFTFAKAVAEMVEAQSSR
jgi:putative intracellular protease/amidase